VRANAAAREVVAVLEVRRGFLT